MTEKPFPYRIIENRDREEWLQARTAGIGGSDAAAVLGMNPYKSNLDLYREKTGQVIPEDISGKPYVRYGTEAEPHIRALFALDYPEYVVEYHENRVLQSLIHPFMQASLDGELTDQYGHRGILEIKTSNIINANQREKWDNKIPDNYYLQVLHYLFVTGYEFVVLRAHLNSDWQGEKRTQVKHYFIERAQVEEDIKILEREEMKFWECVEKRQAPPLILPEI